LTTVRKYADPSYSDSEIESVTDAVSQVPSEPVEVFSVREVPAPESRLSASEKVILFLGLFFVVAVGCAIFVAVISWTFGVLGIVGAILCFGLAWFLFSA
jgi:hypothetical protein